MSAALKAIAGGARGPARNVFSYSSGATLIAAGSGPSGPGSGQPQHGSWAGRSAWDCEEDYFFFFAVFLVFLAFLLAMVIPHVDLQVESSQEENSRASFYGTD